MAINDLCVNEGNESSSTSNLDGKGFGGGLTSAKRGNLTLLVRGGQSTGLERVRALSYVKISNV